MLLQQDADCLSSYLGHQFALDRLLGHQSNGPAGTALRGIGAHHGDDALALCWCYLRNRTGSRPVVQRSLQSLLQVAATNLTDGFGRESVIGGHFGSSLSLVQLRENQRTKNDSNRLDSALQKTVQFVPVSLGQTDMETPIGPHDPV